MRILFLITYIYIAIFLVKLTSAPSNHPHPELFNVKEHLPTAIIDMRYATKNNFVGKKLYKDSNAYLRKETIEALKKVISELEPKGFRLIILDAYRPPSVQKALFESTKYKAFVAPPIPKYNRHGRGTAVDASLADLNGKPVEMPSKFDEFSKKADQDFSDVSKTAGKHARILIRAFHQAGFSGLRHEWWHFDLRGWQNFEIIEN